jgi:hypothetical protein
MRHGDLSGLATTNQRRRRGHRLGVARRAATEAACDGGAGWNHGAAGVDSRGKRRGEENRGEASPA